MKHPRQRPTPKQRREVFRKWRGCCAYCGKSVGDHFHLDHIKPVAKGGKTVMSNLVLACPSCNLRKGTKSWKPKNKELQEIIIVGFGLSVVMLLLLAILTLTLVGLS